MESVSEEKLRARMPEELEESSCAMSMSNNSKDCTVVSSKESNRVEEQKILEDQTDFKQDLRFIFDESDRAGLEDIGDDSSDDNIESLEEKPVVKNNEMLLDRFGFVLDSRQCSRQDNEKKLKENAVKENERIVKWRKILICLDSLVTKKCAKLRGLVLRGIPASLRGRVWPKLAKVKEVKAQHLSIDFKRLCSVIEGPTFAEIKKDIDRTFHDHIFFQVEEGQKSLERVLKALSLVFRDVGYCQGMNFVTAILVMYCNEEDAFWIMVSLLKNYGLKEMYKDPESVRKELSILDRLVQKKFPKLQSHFLRNDFESTSFAVSWWLTLFTGADGIPFCIGVRVMDLILLDGTKVLFRVALNILKIREKEILAINGIENLIPCLRKGLRKTEYEDDDDLFFKVMFT